MEPVSTTESITLHNFTLNIPDCDDVLQFYYINHPKTKKLWISGHSVARSLRYKNAIREVQKSVANDNKISWKDLIVGYKTQNLPKQWHPETVMIDEVGFHVLIVRSRMPTAKKYSKWIFEEVLPSIRNKGYYIQPLGAPTPLPALTESTSTQEIATNETDPEKLTLIEEIQRLNYENTKMKQENQKIPRLESHAKRYQSELTRYKDNNDAYQDKIEELYKELAVYKQREAEMDEKHEKIETLGNELVLYRQRTTEYDEKLQNLGSELVLFKQRTTETAKKLENLGNELVIYKQREAENDEKLQNMSNELVVYKQREAENEKQLVIYKQRQAEYDEKMQNMSKELVLYKQLREVHDEKLKKVSNELVVYKHRVTEYDEKLENMGNELVLYKQREADYDEKLENMGNELVAYKQHEAEYDEKLQKLDNELVLYKRLDEEHTEKIQEIEQMYEKKNEESIIFASRFALQKIMYTNNLQCVKMMASTKDRVIPDIAEELPNKVNFLALYVLDRNTTQTFDDNIRPKHYISRSQKQRIDNFDKVIAESMKSVGELVCDQEAGKTVVQKRKAVPKGYEWLNNAQCYFKHQCPNAVAQWVDFKQRHNPLWFGIKERYNMFWFMTKDELKAKMDEKHDKYEYFYEKFNICTYDDLYTMCYTPYEREKEVLRSLIEEEIEKTNSQFDMTKHLKRTIKDITMDEFVDCFHNISKETAADEEEFIKRAKIQMITQ